MTEITKLKVTDSPHLVGDTTTRDIMKWVLIALVPSTILAGVLFGWRVYGLFILALLTAQVCEILWFKLRGQPLTWDLSALVTAVLLTMNLPPSAPWYFPVIGSSFAIIVVKECFGGLGYNFLNPALGGRALLVALFFEDMFKISWPDPPFARIVPDAVTQATPLAQMKESGHALSNEELWQAFLGNTGGRIGETSSLLLLLAFILLVYKKIIQPQVPLLIIGTVALGTWLFAGNGSLADGKVVLGHVISGGLLLGAIFMTTDYASSPTTQFGQYLYAVGIGILIVLFRFWGATSEGVSYAILTMNCATPLIDRIFRQRVLGEKVTLGKLKIKGWGE